MTGNEPLTASTAARELQRQLGWEVSPRDISLLFYSRELPDERAPVVGGRRIIDRELLPEIANALRRKGCLRRRAER